MDMDVTRARFEQLTKNLVDRTIEPMHKAMKDPGVTSADLEKVILVGGSTRIPAVQEAVKNVTGKEPNTAFTVHRDTRRSSYKADRKKYYDPYKEEPDLLNSSRQPDCS